MVPSSVVTIAIDGECLTCGGFSLCETICIRSFEFISDYFGSMSPSARRGDSGATFMGSSHNWTPSPRRGMIEESIEEYLTMTNGQGRCWGRGPRPRTNAPLVSSRALSSARLEKTQAEGPPVPPGVVNLRMH
jgi:hypothetical protein